MTTEPTTPPRSGQKPVSTKPGGVGFTIGRGWGQWTLLAAVCGVVGISVWQGARVGALALVVVLLVCAVTRAVLPARWIPALVNRGRVFDAAVFAVLAALMVVVVASGARL